MSDADHLVTVATFDSLMLAELARGLLEEEGIQSFVADAEIVSMAWYASGAVGGVKLQVAQSDFLAAERLLATRTAKVRKFGMDDYGLARHPEGITTDPENVHEDADDEDEADDVVETQADIMVGLAFRASILGFLLCPPLLHIYSLFLLLQIPSPKTAISPDMRGKYWKAFLIDLTVLGVLAAVLVALVARNVNSDIPILIVGGLVFALVMLLVGVPPKK